MQHRVPTTEAVFPHQVFKKKIYFAPESRVDAAECCENVNVT